MDTQEIKLTLPTEDVVFALNIDGTAMIGEFQWRNYPKGEMEFIEGDIGIDVTEVEKWVPIDVAISKVFDAIDYKTILEKYVQHVGDNEGEDFISRLNNGISDTKFTKQEVKILEKIRKNLWK